MHVGERAAIKPRQQPSKYVKKFQVITLDIIEVLGSLYKQSSESPYSIP